MSDDEAPQKETQSAEHTEAIEAALTALSLSLPPVEPSADARARLLSALQGRERFTLFALEVARAFDLSREAALEALRAATDESAWHRGPAPGSGWLVTPALREAKVVIARLPAKSVIPRHTHNDRELTFVLQGLLIENGATECGPGMLLAPVLESAHELAVGAENDCTVVFYPAAL